MGTAPTLEASERVLIVEGYSDLLFYAEVLEFIGKIAGIHIKQFNGTGDFAMKLETFLTPQILSAKKAIGVIVDADVNATRISAELAQTLTQLSGQEVSGGTWTTGNPKIGLFIVPDGNSTGEIETLVWQAWANDPANTKTKLCVESYLECMKAAGFKPQSQHKGMVSSLLAVRYDEDPRLGPGARTRKVFDFTRPEYSPLKTFLSDF